MVLFNGVGLFMASFCVMMVQIVDEVRSCTLASPVVVRHCHVCCYFFLVVLKSSSSFHHCSLHSLPLI